MAMTKRAFDKMWVYGHAGLFVLCENYDETWKEVEKGNYYATEPVFDIAGDNIFYVYGSKVCNFFVYNSGVRRR